MGNCVGRSKISSVALGQAELLRRMDAPLLWLYGGPCAGKRTQAEMVVETYGFLLLHAADMLQLEARELSTRGIDVSTHLERRQRVPAKITIQMLKERILSHIKLAHGFIICDFPPDVETGKLFEKEVCKPTRILFFRTSVQTMKKRALNRFRTQKFLEMLDKEKDQWAAMASRAGLASHQRKPPDAPSPSGVASAHASRLTQTPQHKPSDAEAALKRNVKTKRKASRKVAVEKKASPTGLEKVARKSPAPSASKRTPSSSRPSTGRESRERGQGRGRKRSKPRAKKSSNASPKSSASEKPSRSSSKTSSLSLKRKRAASRRAKARKEELPPIVWELLKKRASSAPRSSGIHVAHDPLLSLASASASPNASASGNYARLFSIEDAPEEEDKRASGPFDERWERRVQDFYQANADILVHFGRDITQINAERQPAVVFESVKRTLNEICVAKGLTKLIVPPDRFTSRLL